MDLNLQGKVVVVTAGGAGIGKAIAKEFAKEGCKIAICGRTAETLEATKKEFENDGYEMFTKTADAGDYEAVQSFADAVFAHFGRIDVWINNAGRQSYSFIIDTDPAVWKDVMRVNLDSVFWGIKVAGSYMKKSGGVILNTSSFGGKLSTARRAPYFASKNGVNALTKIAAAELAPYNVRVNAVAPGSVESPMLWNSRPPEETRKALARISMQRACSPEEVAKVYVFLASDAASYITGTVVDVDGGKVIVQDPEAPWEAAREDKNV